MHDIYYDILQLFSTFPPLRLYLDGQYFSHQIINANIIYNAHTPYFLIILLRCSCFVFVTDKIHLVHFCYTLEVRVTQSYYNIKGAHSRRERIYWTNNIMLLRSQGWGPGRRCMHKYMLLGKKIPRRNLIISWY